MRFPETFSVPVDSVTVVERVEPLFVPPSDSEAQLSIPAPIFKFEEFPVLGLGIEIAPDTFNLIPELIFNTFGSAASNVMEVQAASILTVTPNPPTRYTLSPATGTDAPEEPPEDADQVDIEFQFPVATEYRLAAYNWLSPAMRNRITLAIKIDVTLQVKMIEVTFSKRERVRSFGKSRLSETQVSSVEFGKSFAKAVDESKFMRFSV